MRPILGRLAALVALTATCVTTAVEADEVSELCRASVHVLDGQPSTAPDICAAVATAVPGGAPRVIDPATAVDAIAAAADTADFVLLGEIHDNPSHHRIRGQVILAMAARRQAAKRPPPGLVLEHIRADQDMAVAGFRALDRVQRQSVEALFKALDWPRSGWPAEALFRPLLDAALNAEWPLLHGNLSREAMRAVSRGGLAALEADEVTRLGLDRPFPDTFRNALLDELVGSHCGLMPREALGSMGDAQRFRDAYMARRLVDAAEIYGGAVLLAGNGHVRADRGVPWHLAQLAPAKRILAVMLAQADAQRAEVTAYAAAGTDGRPRADIVVVTPRVERPDPCVAMKKRFSTPRSEPPKAK
jgi:uncharacterized iron-regulated protein